jgi:hypothetical protein
MVGDARTSNPAKPDPAMEAAMLRRTITMLALAALLAPVAARAQPREWEEDYSDEWTDEAPADDYDVSVDLNVQGSVTFDTFRGTLSPYGDWVVSGSYGQVWRPRVAAGWRPYYYGRWEWTNEGWLWVSDEPFGWAAYHYGRWTYDNYYGWVWVPGYQWAPAWVAWRYSGDVVGWAPLAPGVSVYVSSYPFVDFWWTFVPCNRFVSVPIYSVAYAPIHTRRWFDATAPAPPRPSARPAPGRPAPGRAAYAPAWGGPAPRVIEQRVGRRLAPVRIVAAPQPGAAGRSRPGEVAIYRPETRPAPGASRSDGRGRPSALLPGSRGERNDGGGVSSRENGRGPGAFPAPGRGGERELEPRGNGRAPGAAIAPGWGGRGSAAPPARGPAPAWGGRGEERGGGRGAVSAPPDRGGRGNGGAAATVAPPDRGGRASGGGPATAPPPDRGGRGSGGGAATAAPQERSGGGGRPAPSRGERGERGERGGR